MDNNSRCDYLARIFCVYDSKGEHFGKAPHIVQNVADALRGFEREANSLESLIGQYPSDFTLFEIGTWNERTGEIKIYDAKISHGTGIQFKRSVDLVEQSNR